MMCVKSINTNKSATLLLDKPFEGLTGSAVLQQPCCAFQLFLKLHLVQNNCTCSVTHQVVQALFSLCENSINIALSNGKIQEMLVPRWYHIPCQHFHNADLVVSITCICSFFLSLYLMYVLNGRQYRCVTSTKLEEFRNVEAQPLTINNYVFVAGNMSELIPLPSSGIRTNLQIIFKRNTYFFLSQPDRKEQVTTKQNSPLTQ